MDSERQTLEENQSLDLAEETEKNTVSSSRIVRWGCGTIILVCVILFVVMVMVGIRSEGLRVIKVTALDENLEPRDHHLPLIKQKEALPDYEIIIQKREGIKTSLGTKDNTSAKEGLEWRLDTAISLRDIASIELLDRDKLISDLLVEVPVSTPSIVAGNYRFEFQTERSAETGLNSFFNTPLGRTLKWIFWIACALGILLLVLFVVLLSEALPLMIMDSFVRKK